MIRTTPFPLLPFGPTATNIESLDIELLGRMAAMFPSAYIGIARRHGKYTNGGPLSKAVAGRISRLRRSCALRGRRQED